MTDRRIELAVRLQNRVRDLNISAPIWLVGAAFPGQLLFGFLKVETMISRSPICGLSSPFSKIAAMERKRIETGSLGESSEI